MRLTLACRGLCVATLASKVLEYKVFAWSVFNFSIALCLTLA